METSYKRIVFSIIGITLFLTAIFQALDKNFLALFPFICSVVFFTQVLKVNRKS